MLAESIMFIFGMIVCYFLLSKLIKRQYELNLKNWIFENEKEIRADAVKKSRAVLGGKFSEQIAPYLPDFNYNPSDARFVGAPIDFIIFDGLSDGDLKEIVMLEVKSGDAKLSSREETIRKRVQEGKVKWKMYRVPRKVTKTGVLD